jgi:hypothetical protein
MGKKTMEVEKETVEVEKETMHEWRVSLGACVPSSVVRRRVGVQKC